LDAFGVFEEYKIFLLLFYFLLVMLS